MSSAETSAILNSLGTFEWGARMFGALSLASQVAVSAKKKANVIRLALYLRNLKNSVGDFLDTVHAAMEGKLIPDPDAEQVTPQRLNSITDDVWRLYHVLDYVYESLRRAGLTNNSLTAGSLGAIRAQTESVADVADWLELVSQADQVKAIFDRAQEERDRGELVDLAQID